ncbi:unnamed protein product [Paramecium sonneborni]|uniref:Protein kinase domain-containing protein n=1 Tax=Paramecium sonneborni TaxID=65129 RepID=A0A8S1K8E1_9CILI|nr:unnamed protein product [Paramecium sonneborni]
MGNQMHFAKTMDESIFNKNIPLNSQIQHLGRQNYQHIESVELYKLKNEVTKFPTIFEKIIANSVSSEQEGQLFNFHNQAQSLYHPNLIKYYGFYIDPEITTNLIISKWYYQALNKTIKNICSYHFQYKSLIPEKDLWNYLYQIFQGLQFLETKQQWHLQIQPDAIYLDQNMQVRLIPMGILRILSGYSLVFNKQGQALLSPELIEQLRLKNINPVHDPSKSDIFSLGMTLLEFMTLKSSFDCYSFNTNPPQLNDQLIEERLQESIMNGYSDDLIKLTKNMLQRDMHYRVGIRDVLNSKELNQNYHNQGNNLSPLKPTLNLSNPRQQNVNQQEQKPFIQPSIPVPIEQSNFQQNQVSIFKPYLELNKLDNISNFQQSYHFREKQDEEQLLREQQINRQLEQQLKQQQQMLQQQCQQQKKQQQIIEEQQRQLFSLQQQIKQIATQIEQSHIEPTEILNSSNLQDNFNYQINLLPTPPITYASPIKHTLNDFTENIEIQNRVNQVLAQSRQAISRYKN